MDCPNERYRAEAARVRTRRRGSCRSRFDQAPAALRHPVCRQRQYRCRRHADHRRLSGFRLYPVGNRPGCEATAFRRRCAGRQNQPRSVCHRLVGTRSPYGVPRNPFDARYIPGGSSSGSAVAVAAGLASFALGTDTAGSGRVPAAFNNIVGLKPTRGLLSTRGVVPACRSLDCVSIFALSAQDAVAVLDVAACFDLHDPLAREASPAELRRFGPKPRFGVPPASDLEFFGDREAESLFMAAIAKLEEIGGTRAKGGFRAVSRCRPTPLQWPVVGRAPARNPGAS